MKLLASLYAALLLASTLSAASPPVPLRPIESFTLPDLEGKEWSLAAHQGKATVIVFLSCECPMSNAYLEPLEQLSRRFASRGVVMVGINANRAEALADQVRHRKEYLITFPVLRDPTHVAVSALHARVNPEVFVLDSRRIVRYRGRIDDGYSARMKPRPRVTRQDLAEALEDVLAGKQVREPQTVAFGCPIPDVKPRAVTAKVPTVTFHRDVLPILQENCQSCHRPGQVGPFSLMTYRDAVKWSEDLVGETRDRRMPPWKPTQRGVFVNERCMSDSQIRKLETWVEQEMAEGDPREAPAPRVFRDGWQLGKPDLVLEMPSEAVIGPTGRDLFHVVVFSTSEAEDRYLAAVEVLPGNPRVLHHTLQILDTKGRGRKIQEQAQAKQKPDARDRGPGYHTRMGFGFLPNPAHGLGGWAPGLLPQPLPEGVGIRLPRGADVVMQLHYHRTGKEERDRTRVGLYFQKKPVENHFQALPIPGLFLSLPPKKDVQVRTTVSLTEDVTLYYLVPHMHLLGKRIELTAQLPGSKEESLITIEDWDYNWQEMYQLKNPRKLPRGTVLRVKAVYDNSAENPLNPHSPPRPVRLGEQTTNEMCFVFCGVSAARPSFPKFALMPFAR